MSTISKQNNPFSSPSAKANSDSVASPLFSQTQIGIASFLGSALAGMTLVAINHFRLNNILSGVASLLLGIAIVAVIIPLGMILPIPGVVFSFVQMGVARMIAKTWFAKQYESNEAMNVGNGSGWVVAGITVTWIVIFVAVLIGIQAV